MRFLLTGGSGFVGENLARKLRERGHEVTALVRATSVRKPLEKLGVRFAIGDLNNGNGIEAALEEAECVLHLAGVTKALTADDYHRCNAEGTRRLMEAASRVSTPPRVVFCS